MTRADTICPDKPLFGDVQGLFDRLAMRTTGEHRAGATRLRSLTASLLRDLARFGSPDRGDETIELLEVMAGAVRHGRALRLHLQCGTRLHALTVFPRTGVVHLGSDADSLQADLPRLAVMHVEPATLTPDDEPSRHAPLAPLLWQLAMRGSRAALLPEIDGFAAYRVSPSAALAGLPLTGPQAAAVSRLQNFTLPLHTIARWPGLDGESARRLLNGLYLQSSLIVSRSHPWAVKGARSHAIAAARQVVSKAAAA